MNKPWLDRVAVELVRHGVPRRARVRLLAELRDHLDDIKQEGFDMDVGSKLDARLGDPGEVAAVAVTEYRRAGWVRRHPLLTFGLAPLPAVVLGLIGYTLAFVLVGLAIELILDEIPRAVAMVFGVTLMYSLPYMPFVLIGAWLGRLAGRHAVGRAWFWVAVAQVALFAGSLVSGLVLNDASGKSFGYLGFSNFGLDPVPGRMYGTVFLPPSWAQLPQLLAPALAAWLVARRAGRRAVAV